MTKLSPELRKSTRRQIAQTVNRVLNLAAFTGAIKVTPLPRGWLPKAPKAESIGKESLLPSEEARLLAGRNAKGETVVPLAYRVAYAFMHREGMRKGEAEVLAWAEVDLSRGLVSLDENKTDRPRSWVLDPGVRKVLERWKTLSGKSNTRKCTGRESNPYALRRRNLNAAGSVAFGSIVRDSARSNGDKAPDDEVSRTLLPPAAASEAIEVALAKAPADATAAWRFEHASRLLAELRTRREARSSAGVAERHEGNPV
jgi:hypothetical protein